MFGTQLRLQLRELVCAKLTGKRIFDRFWEVADQVGVPRNPYRLGFLQTIAVAETDARAEEEYAPHLEYAFRKGLGTIPPHTLGLPGGIDIRGVEALIRDPSDSASINKCSTSLSANSWMRAS